MNQNRNRKMRLLSFLLACSLLVSTESLIVSALEPKEEVASATLVATQDGATVLAQAEESAVPAAAKRSAAAVGYIELASEPEVTEDASGLSFADAAQVRSQVLRYARAQLGAPYVYGGAAPGGFDCSGFVMYVYSRAGYQLSRTASSQLYNGTRVSYDDLQPGDLVFFRDPGSSNGADHVGIYVGNRMMIHASSSKGISYAYINSSYFSCRYIGARRIIDVDASQIYDASYSASVLGLRSTQ